MEHCLTPGNYSTRAGEPRPYPWQSVLSGNLTSGGFGTRPYEGNGDEWQREHRRNRFNG